MAIYSDNHAAFSVGSQQPLGVMRAHFTQVGRGTPMAHGPYIDPRYRRYIIRIWIWIRRRILHNILIKSEVIFFAESQLQHHFAPYFLLVSDKCMLPAHSPPPNCTWSTSQPQSAPHSRTPSGNFKKHGHWEERGEEREKRRSHRSVSSWSSCSLCLKAAIKLKK